MELRRCLGRGTDVDRSGLPAKPSFKHVRDRRYSEASMLEFAQWRAVLELTDDERLNALA